MNPRRRRRLRFQRTYHAPCLNCAGSGDARNKSARLRSLLTMMFAAQTKYDNICAHCEGRGVRRTVDQSMNSALVLYRPHAAHMMIEAGRKWPNPKSFRAPVVARSFHRQAP